MRMLHPILAALLISVPGSGYSQSGSPQNYNIEMQVFRGDALISSPQIVMQEGATAEFTDEGRGFAVRIQLARSPENGDFLRVAADVQHQRDGRLTSVGSPVVFLREGEARRIDIPAQPGTADRQTYALSVKATPRARISS